MESGGPPQGDGKASSERGGAKRKERQGHVASEGGLPVTGDLGPRRAAASRTNREGAGADAHPTPEGERTPIGHGRAGGADSRGGAASMPTLLPQGVEWRAFGPRAATPEGRGGAG